MSIYSVSLKIGLGLKLLFHPSIRYDIPLSNNNNHWHYIRDVLLLQRRCDKSWNCPNMFYSEACKYIHPGEPRCHRLIASDCLHSNPWV
jgi:hypothetical protein